MAQSNGQFQSFQGYYNPQRYDVNANNEITARDMSILAYHIVNDLPEMLEYISKLTTRSWKEHPTSNYDNYNTSLEGGKFSPLKEQMDSNWIQPDCWLQLHRDNKRGKQQLSKSFWGLETTMSRSPKLPQSKSGIPWLKMFADYQYKKSFLQAIIPSTGRQFAKQDFYATVRRGRSQR